MNKQLKIAAIALASFSLAGCFPEDNYPTITQSDITIEGSLKDYYQKPIEGLQIVMYRKMEEKQTLLTTADSLICDTVYSDASGFYRVQELSQSEVSLTYGIHISDTSATAKYRTIEQECSMLDARQYVKNNKYELVYQFSPIIYTIDWPGFNDSESDTAE
jgi:hypothetical protein